ncbi:hypothetical protein [Zunongwangia endophytica]|uniref:Uncharacterized protein n=1 Tax=Zunongwangia endophytica TaxID=1808945 RepID=A0ABV8HE81_9FLAO|nr:hypothetical protein [Zunongwangia endophytica]MDN3594639.1 hypothetical protein [Zunongwangia endophytica]
MQNQIHQSDSISAYPLFEDKLRNIRKKINQIINFNHPTPSHTRNSLFQLDNLVEELITLMRQKPKISNKNLEYISNELYKRDREINGVRLTILFYENSDMSKLASATVKLGK